MNHRRPIYILAFVLLLPAAVKAAEINGCPIRPATLCIEFDLRAAKLQNAELARADLSGSDLSGADLGNARLVSADLDRTKFNRANLAGANLSRADLGEAQLHSANLRAATLTAARLRGADMNGANLDGADLRGADLSGAHLPGASLRNAYLQRADLSGTLLKNADLAGADLSGAILTNAVLENADLTGARLTGAVFDGARVGSCRGCPGARSGPVSQSAPAQVARTGVVVANGTVPDATANGCWARIFVRENFVGPALTLVGPTEVDNVARHLGFPWDPMYESVEVGPRAMLSVFDEPGFRQRNMKFKPGERVSDLDDVMGVFRTIRSARLACP